MGATTVFGTVDNSNVASEFYMSADGTVSTNSKDGEKFVWNLGSSEIVDDSGNKSTFSDFLSGLGTTVNSFLDIVNKTAQTYENTTGSKIINTESSQAKSGQLSSSDLNNLSGLINSSINQLKKNALYIGVGISAIIVTAMIIKNKKAKAK